MLILSVEGLLRNFRLPRACFVDKILTGCGLPAYDCSKEWTTLCMCPTQQKYDVA